MIQVILYSGFLDLIVGLDELTRIVKNPEANREWHSSLSEVAGVYLIVDTGTGDQYVGSAYGEKGIMGRWGDYVRTGHGGNAKLKAMLSVDPDVRHRFQFTVLRTLSKTLTRREVIEFESLHKRKLGTKAFGLNVN